MDHNDLLFRNFLPPRGIKDDLFHPATFLDLQSVDANNMETSVSAVCAFPNEDAIHTYGQGVAAKICAFLGDQPGLSYGGFYTFEYSVVTKAMWKYYTVSVFSSPEGDNNEHFALKVIWNRRTSTNRERKAERASIRLEISNLLRELVAFGNN